MIERILENIATFQSGGSQWVFLLIVNLEIHSVRYAPLRGSSYIPLPELLRSKKAIINMKNSDQECFKWCIARAINPVERKGEKNFKRFEKTIGSFEFPRH